MMKLKQLIFTIILVTSAVCVHAQTAEHFPTDSLNATLGNSEDDLFEMELDSLIALKADSIFSHVGDEDSLAVDTIIPLMWPQSLQSKIDNLVKNTSLLHTSTCGIMVYDLTADSIIYKYNERQRLRPASTMKVLTTVTALNRLGSDHRFRTRMAHSGMVEERHWLRIIPHEQPADSTALPIPPDTLLKDSRVLAGDIYVKGGMDPMFSTTDLSHFVEAVEELRIDSICGNIVLDLSLKDTVSLGEGWCWDDDNPSLNPLLVDKKPQFAELFIKMLQKKGIVFAGEVIKGNFKEDAQPMAEASHTLYQIMKRTMKNSDNTYAECIFYKIGAETSDTKGVSAKAARKAVNELIESVGMKPDDYYIADGSGLSLYNYLAPDVEVYILRHAYFRDIFEDLYAQMPIAGVDGTLGKRMMGTRAFNNVHAKTGTLTGVSTLAGYCQAKNGHWLCFSIMNNGLKSSSQGRSFQDRVCGILCSTE